MTPKQQPVNLFLNEDNRLGMLSIAKIMSALGIGEGEFSVEGNSINVSQMDQSHVAMIRAKLLAIDETPTIEATERKTSFAVTVSSFQKALTRLADTYLTVGGNVVELEGDISGLKTSLNLPLLEPNSSNFPEPKVQFDAHIAVDMKALSKAIAMLDETPDAVVFAVEGNNATVIAVGENGQRVCVEALCLKDSKDSRSVYSWALMEALATTEDAWTISFATDMPMKAEKNLTTSGTLDGKEVSKDVAEVSVWVAPRIEAAS